MVLINFYRIVSSNTEKVYVGSTEHTIEERLHQHESNYRRFQDGKDCYVSSSEVLDFKDYSIQLIETKDCETRKDRFKFECEFIIDTPNTVNKYMPGRTVSQWHLDNKEDQKGKYLNYYRINKEQIKTKQKHKHACPCGGKYTTANKTLHMNTQKHQHFITNQLPIN